MSDIKMSDWFNLPTTPAKFWLAPVERDNDDRRRGQMIALTEAINSHDKLTARIAELESALIYSIDIIKAISDDPEVLNVHKCHFDQSDIDYLTKALKDNS